MIVIRGNNLHPASLQRILHRFAEVAEYNIEVDGTGTLPVLRVRVGRTTRDRCRRWRPALAARVGPGGCRDELLFRAESGTRYTTR